MSTTAEPYDWGLDEHQLEVPNDETWPRIEAYRKAADAEHQARLELRAHLAHLTEATPPAIGDHVTPWAVLKVGGSSTYPIVDVLPATATDPPGYLVRLSGEHDKPEWGLFHAGDFIIAMRRDQ